MTTYIMKFETNHDLAEVRVNAFLQSGDKFASHSLTNDELEWVEPDDLVRTSDLFIDYVYACVPQSEAEGLFEFLGSLDHYAKQHLKENKVDGYYSCLTCGAFTDDPKHALIKYFHAGCKG